MKITIRGRIFALLLISSAMPVLASHAQGTNEPLPPEVKMLIGIHIKSNKQGEFGRVENWKTRRWTTLNIFPKPNLSMGVEELYRDNTSIFVVELMNKADWSMTLLDVRVLPRHMLNYDVKNGTIVWSKNSRAYRFESMCYRKPKETIVAIMRPERGKEDCTHTTRQVKRAWKIDQETGHISEISAHGVSCAYMESEYSCNR